MTKYAGELRDFGDLLRAVADWKDLPAAIIEKDYYLVRALRSLAEKHDGQFILKGGTSLSKGWNLLDRFSEDLDILVRSDLGWGKGSREKRLKALRDTIASTPGLRLAEKDSRTRAETGVSRTVVYLYDSMSDNLTGLGKSILFEAGYRGSTDGAVRKSIQSWVAEYATEKAETNLADDLSSFEIDLQNIRRTFVEKLFAIHAAYMVDRCANRTRHYYDTYKMSSLDEITVFVGTKEYRECVLDVRNISQESFPGQPLPDGDSFATSPAFSPSSGDFSTLEKHYKREEHIFFSNPAPLRSLLDGIAKLLPKL